MISTISGVIRSIHSDRVIVEVGGVGLSVLVSTQTALNATLGTQISLFTSLVVREDSLTLYGFTTEQARHVFELVQTVSGIGPKVALSILSGLTPGELAHAIEAQDVAAIERIPGIGRKGAQRIILELKGKLSSGADQALYIGQVAPWRQSLTGALISLGFSAKDADAALSALVSRCSSIGVDPSSLALSELLKDALANGVSSHG